MADWVRVRDKATRHEYTIRRDRLNAEAHEEVDKPAVSRGGDPLPVKHNANLRGKRATKSPDSTPEPVADGHEAGSEKENR